MKVYLELKSLPNFIVVMSSFYAVKLCSGFKTSTGIIKQNSFITVEILFWTIKKDIESMNKNSYLSISINLCSYGDDISNANIQIWVKFLHVCLKVELHDAYRFPSIYKRKKEFPRVSVYAHLTRLYAHDVFITS